jgi:hypothetical protein
LGHPGRLAQPRTHLSPSPVVGPHRSTWPSSKVAARVLPLPFSPLTYTLGLGVSSVFPRSSTMGIPRLLPHTSCPLHPSTSTDVGDICPATALLHRHLPAILIPSLQILSTIHLHLACRRKHVGYSPEISLARNRPASAINS